MDHQKMLNQARVNTPSRGVQWEYMRPRKREDKCITSCAVLRINKRRKQRRWVHHPLWTNYSQALICHTTRRSGPLLSRPNSKSLKWRCTIDPRIPSRIQELLRL
ncbi:hypothetical protein I3843_16G107400 [Carya illinoinensis]|nr:hypothetical protein I3843_16G107400 [Carya illinoinensis]